MVELESGLEWRLMVGGLRWRIVGHICCVNACAFVNLEDERI